MASHSRLPRFKVDLDNLTKVAHSNNIYAIDSELRGVTFFARGNDFVIATPKRGYIKIKQWNIRTLAEELTAVADDLDFRREAGIKEI